MFVRPKIDHADSEQLLVISRSVNTRLTWYRIFQKGFFGFLGAILLLIQLMSRLMPRCPCPRFLYCLPQRNFAFLISGNARRWWTGNPESLWLFGLVIWPPQISFSGRRRWFCLQWHLGKRRKAVANLSVQVSASGLAFHLRWHARPHILFWNQRNSKDGYARLFAVLYFGDSRVWRRVGCLDKLR